MRRSRTAGSLITGAVAVVFSLGLTAPAEAASGWTAHVQCPKEKIGSGGDIHGYVQGHGWALTVDGAYKAALKNANDQMPPGYRAHHCDKKGVRKGKP
ncbi:hypothetical protein [Streptomyces spectabilis]|uniref:Uncharacterized protein n=1 Tax=Streptomyces spectabilis TaxID=68270 RepID=A0A516RET0_STRST|nr:hypothetical protein [Streptomyces spectabilis]QDQ14166.1 hypothetical protein FH965_29280 [Streptomyces spectabilis]